MLYFSGLSANQTVVYVRQNQNVTLPCYALREGPFCYLKWFVGTDNGWDMLAVMNKSGSVNVKEGFVLTDKGELCIDKAESCPAKLYRCTSVPCYARSPRSSLVTIKPPMAENGKFLTTVFPFISRKFPRYLSFKIFFNYFVTCVQGPRTADDPGPQMIPLLNLQMILEKNKE